MPLEKRNAEDGQPEALHSLIQEGQTSGGAHAERLRLMRQRSLVMTVYVVQQRAGALLNIHEVPGRHKQDSSPTTVPG